MGKVYAVGVGPGSPDYITENVKKIILDRKKDIYKNSRGQTIEHNFEFFTGKRSL